MDNPVEFKTPHDNTGATITRVQINNPHGLGNKASGNHHIDNNPGEVMYLGGTVGSGLSWYSRNVTATSNNGTETITKAWQTNQHDDVPFVYAITNTQGGEDTHHIDNTFTVEEILALTKIGMMGPNYTNASLAIRKVDEEKRTEGVYFANKMIPYTNGTYEITDEYDLSAYEDYIEKKEFVDVNGNPLTQADVPTSGEGNEVYVKVTYKDINTSKILGSEIVKNIINYYGESSLVCVKPANTSSTGLDTHFGITDLGRAGETSTAWPMLRKGGWMALESNDKGFVITRMTTAQINALTAQEGMMVYDTDEKCLKLYDGTAWSCFSEPACPVGPYSVDFEFDE